MPGNISGEHHLVQCEWNNFLKSIMGDGFSISGVKMRSKHFQVFTGGRLGRDVSVFFKKKFYRNAWNLKKIQI